jgi:hypothetical protein
MGDLTALAGLEGARFGANMSARGYRHVNPRVFVTQRSFTRTALFIPACFRAVRGVLPRSFPGVLKTSATLLFCLSAFPVFTAMLEGSIHISRSKY